MEAPLEPYEHEVEAAEIGLMEIRLGVCIGLAGPIVLASYASYRWVEMPAHAMGARVAVRLRPRSLAIVT